jgi:AAT family amino acid transporter
MTSDLRGPAWWTFGLLNLLVVTVATLTGWYLLADPRTSPLEVYPLPFNAALFWALMFVIWAGFYLQFAGFARLQQPVRGIAITVSALVFGVVVTWLLGAGLGHLNPDFAADRDGGTGYFTGALFVLFGFSTYVMSVVNWGHWPWPDLGLRQPLVGWCEIAFLILPTLALYVVLGLPTLSLNVAPGSALMDLDTLLGWYYAVVVSIILTGSLWANWPWRLAGSRGRMVVASLVGNVALGTLLFWLLRAVSKLLLGPDNVSALGGAINQFPAQLGVCWVAWMIMWSNAFGNKPTRFSEAANLVLRAAITFGLGAVAFLAYYFVLASLVLHEPKVVGNIAGNALGFMDWFALVTLLYVAGFGSFGLRAPVDEPPSDTYEAEPVAASDNR